MKRRESICLFAKEESRLRRRLYWRSFCLLSECGLYERIVVNALAGRCVSFRALSEDFLSLWTHSIHLVA